MTLSHSTPHLYALGSGSVEDRYRRRLNEREIIETFGNRSNHKLFPAIEAAVYFSKKDLNTDKDRK